MSDWIDVERFEVGKVYEHRRGDLMRIVGVVETTGGGWCFVGESGSGGISEVGMGTSYSLNWREAPESTWWEHWLKGNDFSVELKSKLELARTKESRL